MTAIAAVWSPEGFAISADGLRVKTNPLRQSNNAQKIFSTPFENATGFAFAWAGATAFRFNSGSDTDFELITSSAVSGLPYYALTEEPELYFGRIARRIFIELPTAIDIRNEPEADVIFVGYLNGEPLWAEIHFPHADTHFSPPAIRKIARAPRYFNAFTGSPTVLQRMQESGELMQPLYLSEAIDRARLYVQNCVDNNGVLSDCANFGGHVHVATVTRDGFSWAIPPVSPQICADDMSRVSNPSEQDQG